MNNRQEYFDVATKIGKVVDKTIDSFLANDEFGKYKRIIYEPVLEKKRGKQKSRATMAWLSYCTITGTDPHSEVSEDIAKLITVPELEIWSEYMVNWNFDEKGDVKRNPDIRKKAAVASKSFLEDAIKMSLEVGPDYISKILETSGNVTNAYTKELEVDVEKGELPMVDTEDFLKWRVEDYGRPGVGKTYTLGHDIVVQYTKEQERKKPLSKIKTIIGAVLGSDYKTRIQEEKSEKLHDSLLKFGGWLEVLNDLGDFVMDFKTNDKVSNDQFADIRNGALTPVTATMYNLASQEDKDFLNSCIGEESFTEKEQAKLVSILFQTGTYSLISKRIQKESRLIRKEIKNIGYTNNASSLLKQGISLLESNKIYHRLKQSYETAQVILNTEYVPTWSDELI